MTPLRSRPGRQTWASSRPVSSSATSTPLISTADVRNRIFPKTRSWFALDAPLALLSPLSILRAMFAFAMVSWTSVALLWPLDSAHRISVIVVTAVALVAWIVLLGVHRVSVGWCWGLSGLWIVEVSVVVWSGQGSGLSVAAAAYFVPIGIFAALYFGAKSVGIYQIATAGGLWLALAGPVGIPRAALVTALAAIPVITAPFAVVLLMRSNRQLVTFDPDTGLPNGPGIAERLAHRDPNGPLVIAAIVLRGIDSAQEALGYQAGSELLRRAVEDVGQVLPPNAVIGRISDELVIVQPIAEGVLSADDRRSEFLPEPAAEAARSLARTVGRAIDAGRYVVDGVEVSLRAHAGLSVAPWDGHAVPELVRRATLSARDAVATGAPDAFWHPDPQTLTPDDLSMLADLAMAAQRNELSLAFQPQVSARTGDVVSVEALLRWESPTRGTVSPALFIPLAERTGLVNRLTEWVLPAALDAQMRWRHQGIGLSMSVNLSPVTLTRLDLAESVLDELRSRSLPAECLTLEITETAVTDLLQAVLRLTPLREAGVKISIDDFGSGNTSLSALPHLPLDELKVDQQFVRRSHDSPRDLAIVRTIPELAGRLGLTCVAEGVESEPLYTNMVDFGFDLLQGYFVAKPLAEDDLVQFVRSRSPTESSLAPRISQGPAY